MGALPSDKSRHLVAPLSWCPWRGTVDRKLCVPDFRRVCPFQLRADAHPRRISEGKLDAHRVDPVLQSLICAIWGNLSLPVRERLEKLPTCSCQPVVANP